VRCQERSRQSHYNAPGKLQFRVSTGETMGPRISRDLYAVAAAPQNSLHLEEARPRASSSARRAAALNLSAKYRAFPASGKRRSRSFTALVYRAAGRVIIAAENYERRPVVCHCRGSPGRASASTC